MWGHDGTGQWLGVVKAFMAFARTSGHLIQYHCCEPDSAGQWHFSWSTRTLGGRVSAPTEDFLTAGGGWNDRCNTLILFITLTIFTILITLKTLMVVMYLINNPHNPRVS